ncbi:patatin-like phospholipase family protein [Streptomyces sp. Je 1-4]|uniref:patatin-like phospholipase family protein n=1 Tax=Streptomyces TaxID=1883 RepID=UPI0021DB3598|nr:MULTISPECIES: patatin-like phospholipase family protein [unclassified Streptomyces]UYB38414.1 patatin-like phospholipase family protein [Streptomyces sp. Je 1-4]UZQ34370.1 patatin-like phospholipase family protein [Streptomyces sp. Je 1-4] [Streptomyces sp. Je 1-4 4N24]UZQ41788.1 patatin-like phospholipase family protein [Streptomyces sp. Je 1-4] [Streptomyces sp. Je 1-4 4N24_ara]
MAGTALVLGGGGLTGIGWEIGMLTGLAEAGIDVTDADVVIGTSAGSIVGAHLTSRQLPLEEMYERQLAVPEARSAARMGTAALARFAAIALRSRDTVSFGVRMGKLALAARTVTEAEQRTVIARTLGLTDWPTRRLVVTAVDAATGERTAFDDTSGVGLLDAVGASCAVPGIYPPVTIDGTRWIDGGVHSTANADLASGYGRVVVVAPMAASGGPIAGPRSQGERLVRGGARACVITPDRAARSAFGRNVLDPAKRADAARAGRRQAAVHAAEIRRVWSD